MTEQEKTILTIDWLNKKFDLSIQKTTDEFEAWDAYDDKRIIEFKFRKKYYKEKYIQVDKFYSLLMAADYHKKTAFYIVHDNKSKDGYGYYLYNLSELKNELINSKVVIKQAPYQTEFKKNKKINKYFYILNQSNQTKQL